MGRACILYGLCLFIVMAVVVWQSVCLEDLASKAILLSAHLHVLNIYDEILAGPSMLSILSAELTVYS